MKQKDDLIKRTHELMWKAGARPHGYGSHTRKGGLLYHYTDAAGLCGILQDGDIRATSIHYLNDPAEPEYGRDLCLEFIDDRLRLAGPAPERYLWTLVRDSFAGNESVLFPSELQFSSCFSLKGDVLSQWRAYSDSCRGFALGFSARVLLQRFEEMKNEVNVGLEPWPFPFRILYERSKQLSHLGNVSRPAEEALLNASPELSSDLAGLIVNHLAIASVCFKAPGFVEEQEVKVMYGNAWEMKRAGTKLTVKVRSRNGLLIPYRYLGLPRGSGELLPVRRIVIGPALDIRRTRMALEMLLDSLGYTGEACPEIVASATRIANL